MQISGTPWPMSRRPSSTAWMTDEDDGGLAVLAFNAMPLQSIASILCIIVSERNPLTTHIHTRTETLSNDDARTS